MTAYWCGSAWLPGGVRSDVRIITAAGRIEAVEVGAVAQPADQRLPGLVLPAFANAHSHAFHRALRGVSAPGDFWSWRRAMYALADRLTPDTYLALARALYAEMALAGVAAVGEFHYLHHAPGGRSYADPHTMAWVLRQAAADAGVSLTLLDTCYLAGGIGEQLTGAQIRFGDGDAERWAARVEDLRQSVGDAPGDGFRVGAAIHSVRAVPPDQLPEVVRWAQDAAAPLHVHLSEQVQENQRCQEAYGRTPAQVMAEAGVWGPRTTAVHAVHLTDDDIALLGDSGTTACSCPSTEQDLGDGLAPMARLRAAGCRLAVGSDQHAVVDLLADARSMEMHERLAAQAREVFDPSVLLAALTSEGQASLGNALDGRIAVGCRADLVEVQTDSVRTAGSALDRMVLTASAADVRTVVHGGRVVVTEGRHLLGDVGTMLRDAVTAVREEVAA